VARTELARNVDWKNLCFVSRHACGIDRGTLAEGDHVYVQAQSLVSVGETPQLINERLTYYCLKQDPELGYLAWVHPRNEINTHESLPTPAEPQNLFLLSMRSFLLRSRRFERTVSTLRRLVSILPREDQAPPTLRQIKVVEISNQTSACLSASRQEQGAWKLTYTGPPNEYESMMFLELFLFAGGSKIEITSTRNIAELISMLGRRQEEIEAEAMARSKARRLIKQAQIIGEFKDRLRRCRTRSCPG
jgi:hypothetical protein